MKKLLLVMPVLLAVAACGHQYAFYKADMTSVAPDEAECGKVAAAAGATSLVLRGRDWGTYMQCMKLLGYVDANP